MAFSIDLLGLVASLMCNTMHLAQKLSKSKKNYQINKKLPKLTGLA